MNISANRTKTGNVNPIALTEYINHQSNIDAFCLDNIICEQTIDGETIKHIQNFIAKLVKEMIRFPMKNIRKLVQSFITTSVL